MPTTEFIRRARKHGNSSYAQIIQPQDRMDQIMGRSMVLLFTKHARQRMGFIVNFFLLQHALCQFTLQNKSCQDIIDVRISIFAFTNKQDIFFSTISFSEKFALLTANQLKQSIDRSVTSSEGSSYCIFRFFSITLLSIHFFNCITV